MNKRSLTILVVALTMLPALRCTSGEDGTTDVLTEPEAEETAGECTSDAECDDGIDCTLDTCGFGGVCSHTAIDSQCAEGQVCDETLGCVDAGCTTDIDCDDGIACTEDLCGAGGECSIIPLNERCAEDETCSITNGCISQCLEDADCDNGDFCDGQETCLPEFGCMPPDEPRDCDDNDPCTEDSCNVEENRCINSCVPSAECECPFFPDESYNACYTIAPAPQQRCAFGAVNYNISQVCFTIDGPALIATVGLVFHDSSQQFTQVPAPAGRDFNVTYVISGGCEEHYGISGTFSDGSHFDGLWTANFVDYDGYSCALSRCSDQGIMVSGIRIP